MTVPNNIIGVWKRQGISINGAPAKEDADVFWLQTPFRYADVRTAWDGSAAQAFAGRQSWQSPRLVFHHDLDFVQPAQSDEGDISFDGDDLIEKGSVKIDGKEIFYEERWVRQTSLQPDHEVLEQQPDRAITSLSVKVADHWIVMRQDRLFGASRYQRHHGDWELVAKVGQGCALPEDLSAWTPVTMG